MKNRDWRGKAPRLAARLLAGASATALTFTPAQAFAQDATQDQSPDKQNATQSPPETGAPNQPAGVTQQGDVIVVTGIRASLQSARNIKKNSNQIVDSVTAQDIGALPDRSVSEALQRIPGVTLQRTNAARDPARLSAEGGAVFIRGLSWVKSEFNGRDTFSANNGRSLGFEDVPADLMAGIDVYKNPTADQIEGGIGGIVNLRTRKPFDQPGQLIAASADYNYADLRKKGFGSANVLYSNRWKSGAGDFGILLSASLNNIGNRTDEIQTGAYNGQSGALGTSFASQTYYLPNSLGVRRIDWTQRRVAFDGALQWKPVETLTFTAEGIYSQAKHHDIENVVGVGGMPVPGTSGTEYTFDGRNNALTGHIPAGAGGFGVLSLIDARHETGKDVTKDFSFDAKWEATPNFTVSADVQRTKASHQIVSMTAFDELAVRADVDFDFADNNPWITYSTAGDAQLQQSNYFWSAAMDHREHNNAGQWAYRADAEYRFGDDSFLKRFSFGARGTDREAISRATSWNWSLLSYQDWMGLPPADSAVMLDEQGVPANSGLPNQSYLLDFNNFFRGNVPAPGSFWVPTPELVSSPEHAYEFLKSTLTQGWGWAPYPGDDYSSGSINDQKEKTLAGYGLLSFASIGGLRFDGNVGVRVVRTRNDAGPLQLTGSFTNLPTVATCLASAANYTVNGVAAPINASICDPLIQLNTFLAGGSSIPELGTQIPTKNSYTDVLPTLNLRFFLQDNMFLRFAAGRAMSRPQFSQLAPTISFGAGFNTSEPTAGFPSQCSLTPPTYTCTNIFTGSGANPTLKPIESNQFDASWEYYFGNLGQLSAAVFYKDVKNFIFAGNKNISVTNNGQTLNFYVTQLLNGERGKIKGFELAYQQFYDFLPHPLDGFGLGANLTYVDSSGGRNSTESPSDATQVSNSNDLTLPLEGLSKWAYNLTLMYAKYGVDARLAYNWRQDYLLTTSAANINQPVWSGSYGQLDGSIFYDLNRHFKVGVQATNLLSSKTYLYVGYADRHPFYSSNVTDRRFAAVIRAQF